MKHWTDEHIDKTEHEKIFSLLDIASWLRHLLKDEEKRLKFCAERLDEITMLRAAKESGALMTEYKTRQTARGELKANVRGIRYVLDAFAVFRRKAMYSNAARRAPCAPPEPMSEDVEDALEVFEKNINLGLSSTAVMGRVLAAEVRRLRERCGGEK